MEKDYVKMLMESDKPMEERLRIAGEMINTLNRINENNEARISNYEKMIEHYNQMIEILMEKAGVEDGEHETTV